MSDDAAEKKRKLQEYVEVLEQIKERRKYFHLEDFKPYSKQIDFFNAGVFRERMLSAGNQLGKSEAGAYEMACHLTGIYPDWWKGRKFTKAPACWAAGVTATVVRDVQQTKLFGMFGQPEMLGTGLVPKSRIMDTSTSRSAPDAFDTVHVRHSSGGISSLTFKSYEQGRGKFQGSPVDVVWLDEEPDDQVYDECYARGNATGGIIYTTFTPLQGKTPLVLRFWRDDAPKFRKLIRIRTSDCPFMTPDMIESTLSGTPAYQREARLNGEPMRGQGQVFELPRQAIMEPTIQYVPEHWSKLWSVDFGTNEDHQFAAVLSAWDKEKDVIHVLDGYKMATGGPLEHAVRMKQIGIMVPVAWPHDGWAVWQSRGATESIAAMYRKQGLRMCSTHTTFEGGGYDTEAGLLEMDQRMKTGRFKVAASLEEWFFEFDDYHRNDGKVVKKNDDLLSATRIGVMGKRLGKPVLLGSRKPDPRMNGNGGVAMNAELSGDDLF